MTKEKVQSIAFQLIAYAGDAVDHYYKAIAQARAGDSIAYARETKQAEEELKKAHRAQTELLTAEINQQDIPFSILMTHAQDHLTIAIMTQRMAKEFCNLYEERRTEHE